MPTFCNFRFFINCEADSANDGAPSKEDQVGIAALQCNFKVLHSHRVTSSLHWCRHRKNVGEYNFKANKNADKSQMAIINETPSWRKTESRYSDASHVHVSPCS